MEFYKNASPEMDELEKNIEATVGITAMIKKEMT